MATECASRVLPLADSDRVPPQPKPRRISSSKSTPDADSLLFLHVRTSNSMSQKSDSCGKTAFLSSTQLYWAPCFLMFSLPTYRATSTECCHLQIQRGRSKSETQSSDSRFSVSKPLCVEPDAQSSVVPLIKVLTCFDMHERVSSFCFSVTIFFFFRSSSDSHKNEPQNDTANYTVKNVVSTVDLAISFINTL